MTIECGRVLEHILWGQINDIDDDDDEEEEEIHLYTPTD